MDKKELMERAKEEFGLTEWCSRAGYILPNGEMLDFGYDEAGDNQRYRDHREIQGIFYREEDSDEDSIKKEEAFMGKKKENFTRTEVMLEFMKQANAIRYSQYGGINFSKHENNKITPSQWKTLKQCVLFEHPKYIRYEYEDPERYEFRGVEVDCDKGRYDQCYDMIRFKVNEIEGSFTLEDYEKEFMED